jgi:hypothetical protein
MRRPICRQPDRLPKRFPVGAVYVIEGHDGRYGRLRVSSRYVKLPDGRRIEIAPGQDAPARTRRQWRTIGPNAHGNGPKKPAGRVKNFAVGDGTPRHQPR